MPRNSAVISCLISTLVILTALTSPSAIAADAEAAASIVTESPTMVGRGGRVWEFDPNDQPYPAYVADPRRPRMNVSIGWTNTDIPETSSGRIMLDAGTRYTLFKVSNPNSANEFAIDIEGGLFTQFDLGNQLDSIGWEGVYGIYGVYEWNNTLDMRFGYKHLSAHLGDEYIETTGRERVGYTRDALIAGFAWRLDNAWTAYVEPSWAFGMGNEERQERLGIDGGAQYQGPFDLWNGNMAFYGAAHVRAFKESNWKPGITGQLGYLIKRDTSSSNLRLVLEAYTGRAILGEFALDYDETYLTAGFIFDFY
ncbi:MAG: DUF1207 domain-containing protein [Halopseudomonas sp.]